MLSYDYSYLFGSALMMIIPLVVFIIRKDLRTQILVGGTLFLPLVVTHFFWIPEYWTPVTLFDLVNKIGFGIEDLLWAFAFGGTASIIYETIFNKKEVRIKKHNNKHFIAYVIGALGYIVLELFSPTTTIWNSLLLLLAMSIVIIFQRPDLKIQMFFAGLLMTLFYFVTYQIIFIFYPNFVDLFFSTSNLIPIYLLKIPIEELLLAFLFGIAWSGLYEYLNGYKTKTA